MALLDKETTDLLAEMKDRIAELEEKVALLEEALAPGKVMIPEAVRAPKAVIGHFEEQEE